MQLTNS